MNQGCDTIITVELRLERLGFIEIARTPDLQRRATLKEPRLLHWAIAVLEKSGWTTDQIMAHLSRYPGDRHWWAIRQLLPDAAFDALAAKLEGLETEQKQLSEGAA